MQFGNMKWPKRSMKVFPIIWKSTLTSFPACQLARTIVILMPSFDHCPDSKNGSKVRKLAQRIADSFNRGIKETELSRLAFFTLQIIPSKCIVLFSIIVIVRKERSGQTNLDLGILILTCTLKVFHIQEAICFQTVSVGQFLFETFLPDHQTSIQMGGSYYITQLTLPTFSPLLCYRTMHLAVINMYFKDNIMDMKMLNRYFPPRWSFSATFR